MYNPYDFYFKEAKKQGFKARSAFKIQEIDQRYNIFNKDVKYILDIGCAPGSWMQFAYKRLTDQRIRDFKIVGFDLKPVTMNIPGVYPYEQDITEVEKIDQTITDLKIKKFDIIMSDMAPNTIGIKEIDAIKSIVLLEKTLRIYKKYLKENGKIIIKIFMGPGFDEFVKEIKSIYGGKGIKIFKPAACRRESKETYLIKY